MGKLTVQYEEHLEYDLAELKSSKPIKALTRRRLIKLVEDKLAEAKIKPIPIVDPEFGRLKYFVTFSCQPDIHVYYEKSSVLPRSPYKAFGTLKEAQADKPKGKLIIQI